MLTLASVMEIKSVVLSQLGFRATWDCKNQLPLTLWLASTRPAVPGLLSLRRGWCGRAACQGQSTPWGRVWLQNKLFIAESKRHVMHDWQFGEGRQHNKVVSFVLLLGNAKRSLEVTEPWLVCPFLPWGAHCLSKEVVAQHFFSGEQNHEGRGEHRPST